MRACINMIQYCELQVGCNNMNFVSQTKLSKKYDVVDLCICWRAQRYVIYTPHKERSVFKELHVWSLIDYKVWMRCSLCCIEIILIRLWLLIFRQNDIVFSSLVSSSREEPGCITIKKSCHWENNEDSLCPLPHYILRRYMVNEASQFFSIQSIIKF